MRVLPSLLVLVCVALTAALAPARAQEALSPAEREIVAHVDAHLDEAMALLETTVNINSGTLNLDGVRRVGRLFQAELEDLGFEARWIDGERFGRAGHLVAERSGRGPRLLLIGHLDTVFEDDSPFQRFELLGDTAAHGPGVIDMKGGDVIIVQALAALAAAGVLDDMSVTVVMTGDEERVGAPLELARRALIDAAEAADIAIGFEDGDGDPTTAVVARRGSSRWDLRITGRPAHSSQIFKPEIGAGAINEAARILNRFYDRMAGERYLTFNPGVILGGTSVEFDTAAARGTAFGKNNVIAEHAMVAGDLRTLSIEQREDAKTRMRLIASEHRPHTSARLVFDDKYPPLAPSEGNRRLLAIYDQASRDLGYGPVAPVDPMNAGAADVAFTAGYVDMAIDGIGLMGSGGHTVEETADLRTLPMQTRRAAVLLYRLATGATTSE